MIGQQVLISSVFIAGILSFFAPCTFPLIFIYIGLLTDFEHEYKKIPIKKQEMECWCSEDRYSHKDRYCYQDKVNALWMKRDLG